ncbi:MAG: hypothetical protein HQM08_29685, partial [Candidatus Riflebacteria bacterium]|nr:hypothetical protein [Candidatus Riflebacteria bacterium]
LFCNMLESYYDLNASADFDRLFKGLKMHNNPTSLRNSYLIWKLDFSEIDTSQGIEHIYNVFIEKIRSSILSLISRKYSDIFKKIEFNGLKRERYLEYFRNEKIMENQELSI